MAFGLTITLTAALMTLGTATRTIVGSIARQLETVASDVDSSQGIHVLVAAAAGARRGARRGGGGGIYGGYGGGNYHRKPRTPDPPQPPAWTRLPIGCESEQNMKYCEIALIQSACDARHSAQTELERSMMTPEAACQEFFKGEMKKEPRHMYCRAAAADPKLKEMGEQLKHLAPSDISKCAVQNEGHFVGSLMTGRHVNDNHGPDLSQELWVQAKAQCRALVNDPDAADGLDHGFCSSAGRPGQDCEFLWGIRAGWKDTYGKTFCEQLNYGWGKDGEAGKLRCLALRKQLIRIAQAKSLMGTAMFHKFDDVIRIDKLNNICPQIPADAPKEDIDPSEIEDFQRDEEDVEALKTDGNSEDEVGPAK